jgi:hypothetical protein
MINELEGFSIIINAHRGHRALSLTYKAIKENSDPRLNHEIIVMLDDPGWQTLKVCQEGKIPYHIVSNRCPYKTWHDGAKLATKDWLCFFPEDVYVAKGWDSGLCHWHQGGFNRGIWISMGVQNQNSDSQNFLSCKTAGHAPDDFDADAFHYFVGLHKKEDEVINQQEFGWYCPFLIHRYWYFNEIGGYPNCEKLSYAVKRHHYKSELKRCSGGCGFDNNFREIARQKQIPIHVCLNSFIFHFEKTPKEPAWYEGGFG